MIDSVCRCTCRGQSITLKRLSWKQKLGAVRDVLEGGDYETITHMGGGCNWTCQEKPLEMITKQVCRITWRL